MKPELRGILLKNEPLAQYTSWCVGGAAKQVYKPHDTEDLAIFLRSLPEEEDVIWLGLGSNTLVRDGGFPGTVIITQGNLNNITRENDLEIRAEAGVASARFARYCARNNLQGIEFLAGIPGTIGGALRMNAGCFNGETWQWIIGVETINRLGEIHYREPHEFNIAYRSVTGLSKDEWFAAGYFRLKEGNKEESLDMIRKLLAHRATTQPTGDASCGSVFRNPDNDYAGRLIETCGLKGFKIGGACISDKHANFIVNDGHASAKDIEDMILYIAEQVKEKQGIHLMREVHIIGVH